jgi:hypothetical protein
MNFNVVNLGKFACLGPVTREALVVKTFNQICYMIHSIA